MDQIVGIGLTVVILVVIFGGAFWFARRRNPSRRSRELLDPSRRAHWGIITGYMGNADPTRLDAEEAQRILTDNWSCSNQRELREKIDLYRTGEINDAFDVARVLWLGELGVAAGWLAEPEGKAFGNEGLARLKRVHRSWPEYADALMQGRARWYVEVAEEPAMPDAQRARGEEARKIAERIWAITPW
jgi:hypothetical protein